VNAESCKDAFDHIAVPMPLTSPRQWPSTAALVNSAQYSA